MAYYKVCVCVCVRVRVHRVYICVFVCMCVHVRVCAHEHMCMVSSNHTAAQMQGHRTVSNGGQSGSSSASNGCPMGRGS